MTYLHKQHISSQLVDQIINIIDLEPSNCFSSMPTETLLHAGMQEPDGKSLRG